MSAEALTKTEYGEVFTRQWVVETMLDLIVYTLTGASHLTRPTFWVLVS